MLERRWSEYRRSDGVVIRRARPRPYSRLLTPRDAATVRTSHLDTGFLAVIFSISKSLVRKIRSGDRLREFGRDCKPLSDDKLRKRVLALFQRAVPRGYEMGN